MAKIIVVLYDDQVDGYPENLYPRRHSRNQILSWRHDGSDAARHRLQPSELLGSVSGALGLNGPPTTGSRSRKSPIRTASAWPSMW